MKKLVSLLFLCPYLGFSQSNTFPATGNVGIGTLYPRGILDIGSSSGDIFLTGNTNTGTYQSNFLSGHVYLTPYAGNDIAYLQARRQNNSGTVSLRLRTYDAGNLVEAMHIAGNGAIGIGTINPISKLDVEGNASMLTGVHKMYFSELYSFDITKAGFRNNAGNLVMNAKNGGILFLNRDVTAETHIQSFSGSDAIDIAVFKSNGSVGIGTSNTSDPSFRLFVETGIRTRRVKVDATTWADYVFRKDYRLPELKHVEAFIKVNQHLPDVPSAAEVEKNGLDLGDTQALLLKKIEELTLYIIELNKNLALQQDENNKLNKRIELLEKARK
jgi:hypothetical protein